MKRLSFVSETIFVKLCQNLLFIMYLLSFIELLCFLGGLWAGDFTVYRHFWPQSMGVWPWLLKLYSLRARPQNNKNVRVALLCNVVLWSGPYGGQVDIPYVGAWKLWKLGRP